MFPSPRKIRRDTKNPAAFVRMYYLLSANVYSRYVGMEMRRRLPKCNFTMNAFSLLRHSIYELARKSISILAF